VSALVRRAAGTEVAVVEVEVEMQVEVEVQVEVVAWATMRRQAQSPPLWAAVAAATP